MPEHTEKKDDSEVQADSVETETVHKKIPEEVPARSDPVRRLTLIVLGLCILLFIWFLQADRVTPYTSQARVQDYVIPLVARAGGQVIKADVELNQIVEKGDVLVKIDPVPYDLQLAVAEADLTRAQQNLRAGSSGLATSEANLRRAKVSRRLAQGEFDRIEKIYNLDPGATSEASRTRVRNALAAAEEQVQAAQSELQRGREQLAARDDVTPEIRRALAAVDDAKRMLKYTKITAPARGMAINMNVEEGMYAKSGSPVGVLVSFENIWIEAYMRENSIGNVKVNDPVEIALDFAPGKIFNGKVSSIGYAVAAGAGVTRGYLSSPKKSSGWLRDAQQFPVIIEFTENADIELYRLVGGQADVVIYTGDHPFLNYIARRWIRLASYFSYVY
jgi:multidrug resistance efflux pump